MRRQSVPQTSLITHSVLANVCELARWNSNQRTKQLVEIAHYDHDLALSSSLTRGSGKNSALPASAVLCVCKPGKSRETI